MGGYHSPTANRLAALAYKLGIYGVILRSDSDVLGRYLLYQGELPCSGLGWSESQAIETLRELAANKRKGESNDTNAN